jgi:hypothetical protein
MCASSLLMATLPVEVGVGQKEGGRRWREVFLFFFCQFVIRVLSVLSVISWVFLWNWMIITLIWMWNCSLHACYLWMYLWNRFPRVSECQALGCYLWMWNMLILSFTWTRLVHVKGFSFAMSTGSVLQFDHVIIILLYPPKATRIHAIFNHNTCKI